MIYICSNSFFVIVAVDKKSSALVCGMLTHVRRLEDGITAVPFLQVLLSLVSQAEHVEALVEIAVSIGVHITVHCKLHNFI